MSCLHKQTLKLVFPCQINVPDLMNRRPGSHPVGALGCYRSRSKGKGKWRLGLELTFRGENLGKKPKVYNNNTVEMCRSNWKRSFGSVTKRGSVATREDSGEGKASYWHGHYQRCQHGSDRYNKLILTSSHLGLNKTMHQNTGLENWLW